MGRVAGAAQRLRGIAPTEAEQISLRGQEKYLRVRAQRIVTLRLFSLTVGHALWNDAGAR